MTTWNNCEVAFWFGDERCLEALECDVRIDKKRIVVTYEEEDESLRVTWRGNEDGVGHY